MAAPAPVHVLKSNKCSSPSGHNSALLMPPLQDLVNHKDFLLDTSVAESHMLSWGKIPTEKPNFTFLWPWSLPHGHYPKLVSMDEGWFKDCSFVVWYSLVFTTIVKCFGCIIAVLQTTVEYDEKVIVWKLSFLHRLQLEWFLQRLTRNSTSIVTALWSNCACNWNNRSQFHKHKCV